MVEIKQLDKKDYDILDLVAEGSKPDPQSSIVLLAHNQDEIVGRVMLLAVAHIEGTWVREDHRNGLLGKRLLAAIENAARAAGIKKLFAYTDTEKNGEYMQRLGYAKTELIVWARAL